MLHFECIFGYILSAKLFLPLMVNSHFQPQNLLSPVQADRNTVTLPITNYLK
jgi:hypothetical protein